MTSRPFEKKAQKFSEIVFDDGSTAKLRDLLKQLKEAHRKELLPMSPLLHQGQASNNIS